MRARNTSSLSETIVNVLQIYKTYRTESTGGVEHVIKQISLGTTKLGVNNRIVYLSKTPNPKTLRLEEAECFRFHCDFEVASTGFSLAIVRGLSELLKWADIIHYHYPWPYGDLLHFICGVKKPSLVTYHSDIVRQQHLMKLYRPLQQAFLNSVNTIVATSPNYLATSETLKKYATKTKVVSFGLDENTYPIPSLSTLTKWHVQFGERFFLFVGVLRYYKGLHILLEACRHTDFKVVIVGAGVIEKELKKQAAAWGLDNVHFIGNVNEEDKVALLALCTAMVFPSHLRAEAFGVSLLEAAMFGKPLISSEIGTGTSYINVNNETGLVIPPSDPDALKNAMHQLWSAPHLVRQMGEAAYKRFLDLFTAEKMAKQYYQLYRSLLEKQSVCEY